jgi:hypothetical protein
MSDPRIAGFPVKFDATVPKDEIRLGEVTAVNVAVPSGGERQAEPRTRCAVCGWPMDQVPDVCRVGNCALRPLPKTLYDRARVIRDKYMPEDYVNTRYPVEEVAAPVPPTQGIGNLTKCGKCGQEWDDETQSLVCPHPISRQLKETLTDCVKHGGINQYCSVCLAEVAEKVAIGSRAESVVAPSAPQQAKQHLQKQVRDSLLKRWAKYSDPNNLEWEWDRMQHDKFESHAIKAVLDLEVAEAEISRLTAEREKENRWESGFRSIVTILVGPSAEFEIPQIVEKVRKLEAVNASLKQALRRIDGECLIDHHVFGQVMSCIENRQHAIDNPERYLDNDHHAALLRGDYFCKACIARASLAKGEKA